MPKGFDVRKLTFPAIRFKQYLCTFAWEYDFIYQLPKTETYKSSETIRIPTADILSGVYDSDFIKNYECQRLIVQLINKAFELRMRQKEVREYEMSNKTAYWIEKGKIEKDKFEKIQLIGKQKEKNWHFGISAAGKLYPAHVLMISSHIFFTKDGANLIESKSIQHSSRRRQGKNWWNDKWREKLLAFVKYISDDEETFYLEMGSEEKIVISNTPLKFHGIRSYNIPSENNLDDESKLVDINDYIDELEDKEEEFEDKE